ncbi:MAG TPA: insulinase family protein, partial [Candidatus Kapabacteria bacterium]|nr:insulinase family protein [Candidatus Kapabacteria bacterium]
EQRYWGPSVHWVAEKHDDKGVYEADILTTILDNETSTFHHVLVDSGVVLSASAGYNMQHNVGPLEFDLELKPDNVKKAIALMHAEIKKMASPDYFTDDELSAAKQSTITNRLYDLENPVSFAIGTTASWWGIAGIPFYTNYLENIKKITRQDLADFAKKYLTQSYILGVGANAETLKQLALDPKEVLQ